MSPAIKQNKINKPIPNQQHQPTTSKASEQRKSEHKRSNTLNHKHVKQHNKHPNQTSNQTAQLINQLNQRKQSTTNSINNERTQLQRDKIIKHKQINNIQHQPNTKTKLKPQNKTCNQQNTNSNIHNKSSNKQDNKIDNLNNNN